MVVEVVEVVGAGSQPGMGRGRGGRGRHSISRAWRWTSTRHLLLMARACKGERSYGADVAGVSPIRVQMWAGGAQSRCRCGRASPVPVQMWAGVSPVPVADVAGMSPVLVQMWQG